ncbi:MAG: dTMP kinase [Myxococcota bacterium]
MRGSLIVFEGIDGAGKTTQARHLASALARLGLEVILEKEPTDGPHGARLRASAKTGRLPAEDELALFLADRREHVSGVLEPALARGAVVLVDRYYLSTAAYQGARGLDPDAIVRQNEAFAPIPDRVVWVDVDPAVGVGRVRRRDTAENAFEREEDLRRCRAIFAGLHQAGTVARMVRFDGSLPQDELRRAILHDAVGRVLRHRLGHLPVAEAGTPAWEAAVWAAARSG